MIQVVPYLRGRGLEHVRDILPVNFVRHVVANVDVALITHHAHHVIALIHAPTESVDVRLLWRSIFSHERITLQMFGRLNASDTE